MARCSLALCALFNILCYVGLSSCEECEVIGRTESGWICGKRRLAEGSLPFASFVNVPFAKQPLGELRFKELQPVKPWEGLYDATTEGPICPQFDYFYGPIQQPKGMSEACIHANIYVPIDALPLDTAGRLIRDINSPYQTGLNEAEKNDTGLPILLNIHGGGFAFGSGDPDLHGPEYLITKGVIVVSFNYRIGVFGFLSLNSPVLPGNAGLRDMVIFLRWLRRNAKFFGGNPDDITLIGHSAGAAAVHLLTLSEVSKGLFKRGIILSGSAARSFVASSPVSAAFTATAFLSALGVNATDPDEILARLNHEPIERIMDAHNFVLDTNGLTSFSPVVEVPHPGMRIIDEDPETSIRKGRGKDIPLIIGFTSSECESFRDRMENIHMVPRVRLNPLLMVPPQIVFASDVATSAVIAQEVMQKYFNGTPTYDGLVKYCTDALISYPAQKTAEWRAEVGGAPVFLYEYSNEKEFHVINAAKGFLYRGAAHLDDFAFIFRVNSLLNPAYQSFPPVTGDDQMKDWMTMFVVNFIHCSDPTCTQHGESPWPTEQIGPIKYQDINVPKHYHYRQLTPEQQATKDFYDKIYETPRPARD